MKQQSSDTYLEDSPMAVLYERMFFPLFAYVRSRLSSQEEAEDLLVEVFLAALEWEGFLKLGTNEQIAWLRRVAQHKIIDRYRNMGKMPEVALQLVEETLSRDKCENPEQKVIQQEELQQLQVAIHRLPPLQQQVLFLRFANGLRCVEIASILGKRDSTVRVLLSRTLNHLRNICHE